MGALAGLKELPEQRDAGIFFCRHCERRRNYRLNYYRTYIHLFGLPIFPWGRSGPWCECVACQHRYRPAEIEPL